MHEVERHGDDLALEAGRAGTHVSLQGVLVGEESEGLGEERVVVEVTAVHRPRALTRLPRLVLERRHLAQLGEDLGLGTALLGQPALDRVTVLVGVGVEEVAHAGHVTYGYVGWGSADPFTRASRDSPVRTSRRVGYSTSPPVAQ